jgi:rhodanese-related sulfurtransferase
LNLALRLDLWLILLVIKTMAQNLASNIFHSHPPIALQSDVHVVKSRLEWGEPAFTILDVRDRPIYNEGHIMGAMPMPIHELIDRATTSIDIRRDIYIYGANEEQTKQATQMLRSIGYQCVSELKGGFGAWKAIGGATEGVRESITSLNTDSSKSSMFK